MFATLSDMGRSRKTPDEKIAALEKKQAQLQAQIDDQKAAKKAEETARDDQQKYIWGGMCKALFRTDPDFKEMMWKRADENITRKYDRRVLGLPERPEIPSEGDAIGAVTAAMNSALSKDG